jgi:uncharacterized protein (TIGR02147 family)
LARPKAFPSPEKVDRPNIFGYHNFRTFLRDWFTYLRAKEPQFSIRRLAEELHLASGYLPMVLSGSRKLSAKVLPRLIPRLGLSRSEIAYFENLVKLGTQDSHEAKVQAVDRMSKFRSYQRSNPTEAEFFEYASRWYHLTIREMATLPGFKADPEWIQERLKTKLPLKIIKDSLEFLFTHKYLDKDAQGNSIPSKATLNVDGTVYWAAVSHCHQQMFSLATESIQNTPTQERNLVGYTVGLSSKRFEMAQAILNRALDEIENLEKTHPDQNEAIYQVEIALFPLTKRSKE